MSKFVNLDHETLLPSNRTDFERSFEEGIKNLVKSENFFDWLTDPLKTESKLLDIMAKEAGVLDWFNSDLESDKRHSIDKAPSIHQKAGTRTGIKQGLEALGCRAQISKGEKAYSLHIYNLVTDKALTVDLQNRLYERIRNNKSERDVFELVIGRLWLGEKFKSAQVSIGRHIKIKAGIR